MAIKREEDKLPLDYYDEEDNEKMLEKDEINPEEAAFMEGYEKGETCEYANCGEEIEKDSAIKKVIKGKTKYFCSDECAEEFSDGLEEKK